AAIEEAHRWGLIITGHLCSIGFREAAELGIDNLEHGLWVDTEFASDKQPDVCPPDNDASAVDLDVNGEAIGSLIKTLIDRHVAVTSTMAAWEQFLPCRPEANPRVLEVLSERDLKFYKAALLLDRQKVAEGSSREKERCQRFTRMLGKEKEFELAFVRAGGLLLAGSDGDFEGGIAGFAELRELEMLVEGGFTPEQAIQIATLKGAQFLKEGSRIGSLEVGKQADIMIVKGQPAKNIRDIENVELVFKEGVGYDSKKLIASVKGQVGIH
ncbi:MAG TPA: amidohydrolase family protein, partial [Bryobacteraceae bacterium]|nr:amidohydrolase family protein [Bryobacteraceae bacterium]